MRHYGLMTGRVKWYNAAKGFGFVSAGGAESDILLHANVLRNFGHSTVADGSVVEVRVNETPRGLQATEILSIKPPDEYPDIEPAEIYAPPPEVAQTGLEPARIKWFDKLRGFGFANVFGSSEDVFVHMETVRQCGLSDLQPGEACCIRVVDGPRGKLAAEIRSWESAQMDQD